MVETPVAMSRITSERGGFGSDMSMLTKDPPSGDTSRWSMYRAPPATRVVVDGKVAPPLVRSTAMRSVPQLIGVAGQRNLPK